MTKKQVQAAANEAVNRIVADLSDRRGLRQEWEEIETGIQREIKSAWAVMIVLAFADAKS